jgi:hypothetical protein
MTKWMTLGCTAAVVCSYAALAHAQTVATATPAPTAVAAKAAQGDRMELADNESFLMPLDDRKNVQPSYPQNLLGLNLPPRTVCLRIGIDEKGAVIAVAKAPITDFCPAGVESEFLAASEAAVKTWKFDPALRCVFRNVKDKERAVATCAGGKSIPQAVTLLYGFRFEQTGGTPLVQVITR